jgi:hypothetical protein
MYVGGDDRLADRRFWCNLPVECAMTSLIVVFALLIGVSSAGQESIAPSAAGNTLTLEEVVKLAQAGVSDEVIITRIRKAGRPFDLTTEEILELKRAGISDPVVQTLMDPSKPYTPPPAPPPPAPAAAVSAPAPAPTAAAPPKKPKDPIAAKIPPEPGMYWRANAQSDKFARLEFKTVTSAGSAGKLSKILLRKGTTGYLIGRASKNVLPSGQAVFFYRLPEKANVEELVLAALDVKSDRRELEFGPDAGKPVFPMESVKQYSAEEIDTGLYRVTVSMCSSCWGAGRRRRAFWGRGTSLG